MMNLIYIADPMCSWCYGFSKELSTITRAFPGLTLQIVVGGVRAGDKSVMDETMKRFRLSHWTRVAEASGLPFNRAAFSARQGYVYDTEPACRAIVTTRLLAPEVDLLSVFRVIQHGFYVDGLDTTNGEVLAQLASAAITRAGVDMDVARFLAAWQADATIAATQADFAKARQWGITSFPALLLNKAGKLVSVTTGYTSAEALALRLQSLLEETSAVMPLQ